MEAQIRTELNRIEEMRQIIFEEHKREHIPGSNPYAMKHTDGTFVMMPLIVARSNLLLALSNLKKK